MSYKIIKIKWSLSKTKNIYIYQHKKNYVKCMTKNTYNDSALIKEWKKTVPILLPFTKNNGLQRHWGTYMEKCDKFKVRKWYLIVVAEVRNFHVLFHVVMIKVLLHPPYITPVEIPVSITAWHNTRGHH